MDCVKPPNVLLLIGLTGIGFIMAGCASVDTIRLTSQTFPPKNSTQEVEVIALEPKCFHNSGPNPGHSIGQGRYGDILVLEPSRSPLEPSFWVEKFGLLIEWYRLTYTRP